MFREPQFPILAAASATKPVTEAHLKRDLAAQPVFSKLWFPTLPKIDALEPEVEAQSRKWELMLERLLSARRLPISTTSDGRDLSLTFNSTPHSDDMQIVCGWCDQEIVITESAKSAYEVYIRGNVSCLVDIVYKRLCSCIETALHEQFGPDWQEKIPRKIRASCKGYRNRNVSFVTVSHSLLSYGTFKDLSDLICLEAYWEPVFQSIFLDRDIVKGSLHWFSIVRDSAAHGRSVSKENQERVFLEAKHILSILEKSERNLTGAAINSG